MSEPVLIRGQFGRLRNAGIWDGLLCCVLGKSREKAFPWRVAVHGAEFIITLNARADQIAKDPPSGPET